VKHAYVEVPVNLVYKPTLGIGKLLLGFGPYVAFGVGGTAEVENPSRLYDVEFQKDASATDLNNTPFIYRPMDAGANLLVGYELANRLSLQLNTQLGLTKINSTVNEVNTGEASHKNTSFGLSLGYRF
jgi:hypothetical protein